jgi:hypothetical protein
VLIRLTYILNYLLRRDIAGRTLHKFPDDVFLVAYPGSGGQWLRCLIGNLIDPRNPVTENDVMRRVPDLYHVSRRTFKHMARPRIIFSHECLDADCHTKAIYLVRDPRDVALANFVHRQLSGALHAAVGVEQFVTSIFLQSEAYGWAEEFSGAIRANRGWRYRSRLRNEFLGTPASWGENVMSWLGGRGHDAQTLLMLRYEDLFSDPLPVLAQISDFLGLRAPRERIQAAAARRPNGSTARVERPGSWKAGLPESAVFEIESVWGPLMTVLGYELMGVKSPAVAQD